MGDEEIFDLEEKQGEPCSITTQECLKGFCGLNKEATLDFNNGYYLISNPWGLKSIFFEVDEKDTELIEILNTTRFPPRFSAIWHKKDNNIEFIFSYLRNEDPTSKRKFIFNFKGKSYECAFENASNAILTPL